MWPLPGHFLQAVVLVFTLLADDKSLAVTDLQDVAVLIALKKEWASALLPWDGDPCTDRWLGIDCDSTSRVINLRLPNQRINGSLPGSISRLTALQNLDLSYNSELGGMLPPEIIHLGNLKELWLLNCSFSGTLPEEIGNLQSLEVLAISMNSFFGEIPPSIGQLSHLKWLDLSSNQFSGSLPVTSSSYSGLDMLTKAEHFHLYNNSFSGYIPQEICTPQMALVHLLLNNNQFFGGIPPEIGDLTKLKILRLDKNKLTGSVPTSISQLVQLTSLDLSYNNFDPTEFPPWFSDFSKLSFLAFDAGNLSGPLPNSLFSVSMLSSVSLSFNQINGSLDLQNATQTLTYVNVSENNIVDINIGSYTGTLLANGNPACRINRILRNSACRLVSQSSSPSNTTRPSRNCQCLLGMEPNPMSASDCFCSCPLTGRLIFAARNKASLTEYLPTMQTSLKNDLKLSLNQISLTSVGIDEVLIKIFPNNLISWSQSESLAIVNKLVNQRVDLKMYGSYIFIPCDYRPDDNKESSGLRFGAKIGLVVGLSFAALVVIGVGVIAYLQKKRADKAEHKNKPFANWVASESEGVEAPQVATTQSFSLSVMKEVTNNFSQTNIIGEGGYGKVYLGILPSNKQEVAVKRAKQGSMQGAQEFKIEIELLSKLHHRNLVDLVGFCYENKEQMLVYEYMPNGTLQDFLRERGAELDWKMRLRIALDAARGLAYLHRGVDPPVIHRDIKSTNILLDSKLVAKVADFGLCKIEKGATVSGGAETQVKGTWGYLDPEYFYTNQLSDKSDVYSFGVVLIEIITGRPPILPNGTNTAREVGKTFKKAGLEGIIPLLDQYLTNYPKKDLEMYVDLALWCIEQETANRPSAVDVVKDLEAMEPGWEGSRSSKKHRDMMQHLGGGGASNPHSEFEYSGVYSSTNFVIEPK